MISRAVSNGVIEPPTTVVGLFAVQCGECFTWRVVPTEDEYEKIRETFIEDPWVCSKNPEVSCEDPAGIEYDASRLWVIDKPNIPKTPTGFKRGLSLRKDLSKMDAHYILPTGKKVRGPALVEKFLAENPKYAAGIDVSKNFSFTVPKIIKDTKPRRVFQEQTSRSKRKKIS
ncbi:hypothetical protein GIB67_042168 [Kingdonia uniflora]|uniref:Methyl-CpG-binding domain-containing protein 4 n=1 Tax=Kingdonia uniflora TaxID=39325 RepID=A0A7J7NX30_9MAGN|nr:hypothetical protein GIB67_042168 [Kingdonia uniflora]